MDMDQLAQFQCVVENRNFNQAAKHLSMSQPALSRSIQRLEEELGQPLFERKSRSVDLTDAGLLFRKSAEQILLIVEDTTDNLLKRCKQCELDVAVLALPIPSHHVEVDELFEEELSLVIPPDHPLTIKKQIRVSYIEAYPFVLLDEVHCLSSNITSFCQQL